MKLVHYVWSKSLDIGKSRV